MSFLLLHLAVNQWLMDLSQLSQTNLVDFLAGLTTSMNRFVKYLVKYFLNTAALVVVSFFLSKSGSHVGAASLRFNIPTPQDKSVPALQLVLTHRPGGSFVRVFLK